MCEVIRFLGYKVDLLFVFFVAWLFCCLVILLLGYFVGSFCLLIRNDPQGGGTLRVLSIKY